MRSALALALLSPLMAGTASAQRLAQSPCGLPARVDSVFPLAAGTDSLWTDGAATYADRGGTGCYTADLKLSSETPLSGKGRLRISTGARVAGPGWKPAGDFSVPDIPELCGVYPAYGTEPQYQQTTTVYRRRARELQFTLIDSKVSQGVWEYTTCRLDLPSWEFAKPAAGTDVYRIAVKVKAGKYWRPVRIKANRVP